MDLGAYLQIDDLGKIAEANNIKVPRLRGYRLTKDCEPYTQKEIKKLLEACEVRACEELCRTEPFWDPKGDLIVHNAETDKLCNYFLVSDEEDPTTYTAVRWDKLSEDKKAILLEQTEVRKNQILHQFNMWNKYAGKEGILYIHARIGGGNWEYFGGPELARQSWFLERADDCFDSTYCDIYAKVSI